MAYWLDALAYAGETTWGIVLDMPYKSAAFAAVLYLVIAAVRGPAEFMNSVRQVWPNVKWVLLLAVGVFVWQLLFVAPMHLTSNLEEQIVSLTVNLESSTQELDGLKNHLAEEQKARTSAEQTSEQRQNTINDLQSRNLSAPTASETAKQLRLAKYIVRRDFVDGEHEIVILIIPNIGMSAPVRIIVTTNQPLSYGYPRVLGSPVTQAGGSVNGTSYQFQITSPPISFSNPISLTLRSKAGQIDRFTVELL